MKSYYIGDDLRVEHASNPDVAILLAGGEIDYEASPQLKARIVGAIKAGKRHLVLDLTEVTFIDSTAIGVLAGAVVKLDQAGGGSLAVVCPHEKVLQILEITGLDSVITLHTTREEALAAFAPAR